MPVNAYWTDLLACRRNDAARAAEVAIRAHRDGFDDAAELTQAAIQLQDDPEPIQALISAGLSGQGDGEKQ